MPQIGWFEILIIVEVSILVVGPNDFPIMLNKIGNWIGSIKKYFSEIQKDMSNMEKDVEDEISVEEKYSRKSNIKKKDE